MTLSTRVSSSMVVLLLLAPLATGCQEELHWLSVEAEVKEVCIVGLRSEFEASPDGLGGIVSRVIGGQELGIRLDERFTAELFLSGVGMTQDGEPSSVANFDFIESLRVEVSGGGGPPAELLNFQEGATQPMGENWFVNSDSTVDIAEYIEADDLQIKFEFAGALPAIAWTADMEICLTIAAEFAEPLPL